MGGLRAAPPGSEVLAGELPILGQAPPGSWPDFAYRRLGAFPLTTSRPWPGRPIDQFCFLPPIIAWSVFSQEDPPCEARVGEKVRLCLQPPFSPSFGSTAAGWDPPPVAATGASGPAPAASPTRRPGDTVRRSCRSRRPSGCATFRTAAGSRWACGPAPSCPRGSVQRSALSHFRLCRTFGGGSVSDSVTVCELWHGQPGVTLMILLGSCSRGCRPWSLRM